MAEAVEGVEGERCGEDGLGGKLDRVGKAGDKLDDVRGVEGARRNEVGEREAVQDCSVRSAAARCGGEVWNAKGKEHSRTLSPAPVARLAMEAIQVSCGW